MMSEDEIESNGVTTPSTERHAIGLSFGNSNSSIAYTSGVRAWLLHGLPILKSNGR